MESLRRPKQCEHFWYYFFINGLLLIVPVTIVCLLISHGNWLRTVSPDPSLRKGEPTVVDPYAEVLYFEPASGPFAGRTNMTIVLSYHPMMRLAHATVTVAGRGCSQQAVSKRRGLVSGVTTITCTVAPWTRGDGDDQPVGPVRVTFDTPVGTKLTVTSSAKTFQFVEDAAAATDRNRTAAEHVPTLRYGSTQRFQGIASGGNAIPVRGQHLSRLTNVTVHVNQSDGTPRRAGCVVLDDAHMVCRSPAVHGPGPTLSFDVLAVDSETGCALNLSPTPDARIYFLYPDPVLVDFETFGDRPAVAINGRDLYRGYGIDDVHVRFRDHGGHCNVTSLATDRIVCRSTWLGGLAGLRDIVVSVGVTFERDVTRRSVPPPRSLFNLEVVIVAVTGSFVFLCTVSLLIIACRSRTNEQFEYSRMDRSATSAP
ncbi:uncharacterized protein LOC112693048 [Sipha flava]|uniref:Uncharacterized protein LOC112693048 n=1 Tax=Sipha flava TaxID=143950 RepID=A0A8B8GKZ2_9HEMI|nr:uncharacterized protein LOC112693048 [Sipha flava]